LKKTRDADFFWLSMQLVLADEFPVGRISASASLKICRNVASPHHEFDIVDKMLLFAISPKFTFALLIKASFYAIDKAV
jgi:hypothetical protein